jgi:uncharacterized protein YecE (DUF72 family)
MKKQSPLRIGTAGWSVPKLYAAEIPPPGSHLERYARHLSAVEINSSFYRPHQYKTYERWARSTPEDFRFSVKVPKAMTHERGLADCGALLDRFVAEVTGLGEKLGVFLVQLPPKLKFDEKVADDFFRNFRVRIATPVVLEPRHAGWFTPEIDKWLTERKIARVAADPAPVLGAGEAGSWDRFVYYRWHGSPRIYYSDYDTAALASLKKSLDKSATRGIPTWCIFDNTASGAALGNALALMQAP